MRGRLGLVEHCLREAAGASSGLAVPTTIFLATERWGLTLAHCATSRIPTNIFLQSVPGPDTKRPERSIKKSGMRIFSILLFVLTLSQPVQAADAGKLITLHCVSDTADTVRTNVVLQLKPEPRISVWSQKMLKMTALSEGSFLGIENNLTVAFNLYHMSLHVKAVTSLRH